MQSKTVELDAQRLKPVQERQQKTRIPALVGGINTNQSPSELQPTQSPNIVNMLVVRGRLQSDTGYVPLGTGAISGTPCGVFQVNHSIGARDTILVTTKTAYYLSTTGVWTGGTIELNGDVSRPVNIVSYPPFDWIVITNGVDPVFYFYLGAFHFVLFDLAVGVVARSLAVFHESLLLIGTTEGGTKHLRRVRMSDAGNPTAMRTIIEGATTGIAAIYDLLDTDDDLHCAFPLGPYLILYRHSSIMRATYQGLLNQILFWEYMIVGDGAQSVGAVCPVTIVKQNAYHVVVGANDVYRYRGDYSMEPVGTAIWHQYLGASGLLNQMAKSTLWAEYVPQWDEAWIGIPTDESLVPDTVLRLQLEGQQPSWFVRRFYDTFISVGSLVTRFEEDQSVPLMLLAGPNGVFAYNYVAPLDAGAPIQWEFETKDVGEGGSLSRFDRLVVRGVGVYDIGVEVSLDQGHSWFFLDTINFGGQRFAVLTFNLTAEYMRVRLSGRDPSFKMTWLELWAEHEGEWVPMHGAAVGGWPLAGPQVPIVG